MVILNLYHRNIKIFKKEEFKLESINNNIIGEIKLIRK